MAIPEIQTWVVEEPYLNLHCSLGEGPYYESATHSLRFVDIIEMRLHTLDLSIEPASLKTLNFDQPLSVTADIDGVDPAKKILVGGKSGIHLLHRENGKLELLRRFRDTQENDERLRSNDGAVDPQGRFWVGTMNDFWVGPPQAEGSLYRFNSDLTCQSIRSSLVIPNGIGWSPDQSTCYFVNTTEKRIIAFKFSPSTGAVAEERTFYEHPGPGVPDGFTIDVDGYLWQAFYGEGMVLRISPDGSVVGRINFPTRAITCPVFVGTEIWVTSASDDEGIGGERSKKYGGAIFKVDVGVRGLPEYKFKLPSETPGLP